MPAQSPPPGACEPCARCLLRPFVFYVTEGSEGLQDLHRLRKGLRYVAARSSIYREAEPASEYFTLFQGWAFCYKLLPDGRRQILSFLLPGDSISFQLMRGDRLHFSVQALTDVALCVFDRAPLARYVAAQPELAARLDRLNARTLAAADERLVDLGRRTAHERIAGFLLQFQRRLQLRGGVSGQPFPFPLRQQHMADALGLTSVHVSRVLKDLKAQGMVSIESERLAIHDPQMLRKLSNQGERTLEERLHLSA